jgi:hypothetical protein
MNTTNSSENQEVAHLEKLRTQISTDIEDMQQKENSLREYEQRLRHLVEHTQNSRSPLSATQNTVATTPSVTPSATSVDAEWEKYRRAHSLLEAARRGLCDDRMALKDREEKLLQREEQISRREAWIKVREQELEAQAQAKAKEQVALKPIAKRSKAASLTVAPFIAARNLLMRHS